MQRKRGLERPSGRLATHDVSKTGQKHMMCRPLPSGRMRYLAYHTTPQVIVGSVEVVRGAQIAERLLFRSSKYRPSVSVFVTYVLN